MLEAVQHIQQYREVIGVNSPGFKLGVLISILVTLGVGCTRCSSSLTDESKTLASKDKAGLTEIRERGNVAWSGSTFQKETEVTFQIRPFSSIKEDFESTVITEGPYGYQPSRSSMRVLTGNQKPIAPLRVQVLIPDEIKQRLKEGKKISVFVEFFYDGENETLDSFQSVSLSAQDQNSVSFNLPPEAFTNLREPRIGYEAVFVLASGP